MHHDGSQVLHSSYMCMLTTNPSNLISFLLLPCNSFCARLPVHQAPYSDCVAIPGLSLGRNRLSTDSLERAALLYAADSALKVSLTALLT